MGSWVPLSPLSYFFHGLLYRVQHFGGSNTWKLLKVLFNFSRVWQTKLHSPYRRSQWIPLYLVFATKLYWMDCRPCFNKSIKCCVSDYELIVGFCQFTDQLIFQYDRFFSEFGILKIVSCMDRKWGVRSSLRDDVDVSCSFNEVISLMSPSQRGVGAVTCSHDPLIFFYLMHCSPSTKPRCSLECFKLRFPWSQKRLRCSLDPQKGLSLFSIFVCLLYLSKVEKIVIERK